MIWGRREVEGPRSWSWCLEESGAGGVQASSYGAVPHRKLRITGNKKRRQPVKVCESIHYYIFSKLA